MRAKLRSPRRLPLALAGLALLGLATTQLPQAFASTPSSQTISLPSSPGTNVAHFKGFAPPNSGQANIVFDDATGACDGSTSALRDTHTVTLKVPAHLNPVYDVLIRFEIDWHAPTPEFANDMRLDLFGPDNKLVASSDGSQFQESINLTAAVPGNYSMHVCAFQTTTGQNYVGTISASLLNPPPNLPSLATVTPPTYKQFEAPKGIATDAGEPSIGNNWKSGHTFFTSNINEYEVSFNDKAGTSVWSHVNNLPNASNTASFDPIGWTDEPEGRVFVAQLFLVCSGVVYTDDDFATVSNPSEGCGSGINGFDHETLGGGPYPKGMSSLTGYPHAIYYCSQAQGLFLGDATCARSDDGGITFGTPHTLWHGKCSGLHGHVRVAPDGTVFVPNANCLGKQGVGISHDAGATWTVSSVPDSINGQSDPSVAAGSDGTIYFGYSDGTGRPQIAVSRDDGAHWSKSTDVGAPFGIHNTEFAEVIAGDGDRAAFAFLGTTTRGSDQADSFGKSKDSKTYTGGRWDLYVATTYDRGAHWTTVDATPNDPVQRGCIWNAGGSNPCRNLLDFNDITTDKTGRVMVGFADGCVPASIDNSAHNNCTASTATAEDGGTNGDMPMGINHGAIVRQESGKGLFAKYDGLLPGSGGSSQPAIHKVVGKRSLATTGSTPYLAGLGLLLLLSAVGVGIWRRRHA